MSWLTRTGLAARSAGAAGGPGLLVGAVPGEGFVSLSADARASLRGRSAATLAAAGIAPGSRALLSLNSDGDLAGALLADAFVELGCGAGVVGPRGRMRTLAAFRALRPDVWITTPTGALDFLARLYLEFNVDPLELELGQILVVGEIPSPGTARRLADEFEARVTGLYCDPVFGGVWAHERSGVWSLDDAGVLGLAELARDEAIAGEAPARAVELVLRPDWSGPLSGTVIRTGQVLHATGSVRALAVRDGALLFDHTVGDHALVRGRWLSLPLLRRALSGIDGIAGIRVGIDRGEGTLDKLTISLAFARPGLVENPMWAARAREALAAVTPIAFALETTLATEETAPFSLDDARGHHLGLERGTLAVGGRHGG